MLQHVTLCCRVLHRVAVCCNIQICLFLARVSLSLALFQVLSRTLSRALAPPSRFLSLSSLFLTVSRVMRSLSLSLSLSLFLSLSFSPSLSLFLSLCLSFSLSFSRSRSLSLSLTLFRFRFRSRSRTLSLSLEKPAKMAEK